LARTIWSDAMTENTSARKTMSIQPLVDPSAHVKASTLGRYTEVGARTKLLEVELADYSYVVNDSDIAYAQIGKFCSIAAMTRINPGNHPMHRASQATSLTGRAPTFQARTTTTTSSRGAARIA